MKTSFRLLFFCLFTPFIFKAQSVSNSEQEFFLDPVKITQFEPYVVLRHATYQPGGFAAWKANNPDLYNKEMWYYSESFYIKRDHLSTGITMNEAMIDVSRFESQRLPNQEVIVTFPGYKDVMVLKPGNELIYKVTQ